jgi:PAS domain S-box-containing protein
MAPEKGDTAYREMFDSNPLPMWLCDRESLRFLAVNDAALQFYGYQRQEFLELDLSALEGDPTAATPTEGCTARRHRRKDGSLLALELLLSPTVFHGTRAWLGLLFESGGAGRATELEHRVAQLTGQLEAAQRELETFSYSVSHDLRAPLRHIDGFSRALLDDYGAVLDDQGNEYLTRICQAVGRMSGLIDALQQLSRVARAELNRQVVNLSVTAQIISLELKHADPERQVEFRIADGLHVEADPRLTRQLLEILMGNAWKFSGKVRQSRIEVGAEQIDDETVYFVRDNGAGFDLAYADKLFTVFHRLHRVDEFEGSGVGLAIAQRIVRRHEGGIWAQSAPGEGATFFFTL